MRWIRVIGGAARLAICLIVILVFAAPAAADLVTWDLSGVTLMDGGTATGYFVVNPGAGTFSTWSITVTAEAASLSGLPTAPMNPFTFDPSNSTLTFQGFVAGDFVNSLEWYSTVGPVSGGNYQFHLPIDFYDILTGSPPVVPTDTEFGYNIDEGYTGLTISVSGGQLDLATVPLPPSATLLGFGLIPLAWARRKKRLGK